MTATTRLTDEVVRVSGFGPGSTVHLARLREVPYPEHAGGGTFLYPEFRGVCGSPVRRPDTVEDPVTCKRCLRHSGREVQ